MRSENRLKLVNNRLARSGVEVGLLEPRLMWSAAHLSHASLTHGNSHHGGHSSSVTLQLGASKNTSLAAPSALSASTAGNQVVLHWTDNTTTASGYQVLRSTNGGAYVVIATINSAGATSYSDNAVLAGGAYSYETQAFAAGKSSGFSNKAAVTVPLTMPAAPAGLTASLAGSWVNLTWAASGGSASGFLVLRSTDGVTFTQIAQLTSGSSTSDVDKTAPAGQTSWYEVEAYNAAGTSPASTPTSIAVPSALTGGTVSVALRFSDELVITASGVNDSISLSQSGSTLTVVADGQVFTDTVPAAGVFVYTRGGSASISIDPSVGARTTIETIDGATTDITSGGTNVSAWIDATDVFSGSGAVHAVGAFAGGVSKATGASLADPSDAGSCATADLSLWGTGPVASDVNQGSAADCYLLSSLAAFAGSKPGVLTESAVDMGDGTYTVRFQSGGADTYVRVSGDMPTGPFAGWMDAHPGVNNTMWAMVIEKAFTYFRTGANTYASIADGWMGDVYSDLGVSSSNISPGSQTESAFYNLVSADLAGGRAVTLATYTAPPNLVGNHAYTLVSVSTDASGATHYVVRNPWGVSGDSLEDSQGYATLTFAQLQSNFTLGCQATS